MKRERSIGLITVAVLVVLVAVAAVDAKIAVALGVLYFAALVGFYYLNPTRCGVCGNALPREPHSWELEGKQRLVCSYCHDTLSRERSRRALSSLNK